MAKAKADAEAIAAEAERSAADLKAKAESDVKMASAQSLQATKKSIEDLLVGNLISGKVKEALDEPDYLKKLITAVAERFNAEESCELRLVLPEALQKQLEPWVKSELGKALAKPVEAEFSKKVSGGFTVGPKDGSWYVSLSEETFRELIAEYIRPVTRKLLFGSNE